MTGFRLWERHELSETAIAFLLLMPASHLWAGNSLLPRQKETQYQSLREMSLIHSEDNSNILKWNSCIRHQSLTSINLCGRADASNTEEYKFFTGSSKQSSHAYALFRCKGVRVPSQWQFIILCEQYKINSGVYEGLLTLKRSFCSTDGLDLILIL